MSKQKPIDLEPLAMLIWYEVVWAEIPYWSKRLDWRDDRRRWIKFWQG